MRFLPRPQRGNRPYSHYDQSNPRLASAVRLDPGVLGRLHRAGARDRPLSTLRSIRASSPATIKKKPSATDNRPTSWTPAVLYTSGCSVPTRIWVSGARLLAHSNRRTADDRVRLAKEHLDAGRNVQSSASALRPQASSDKDTMNGYGCFLVACLLLVLQSGCGTTVQPGQRGLRW